MVTSWIVNSLCKDIVDSVEYASNAFELWRELEDRYDQTNGTKLYQIQKEVNDLSQGVLDINGYYTKMKKLWEELNMISAKSQCTCQCTYGAKENMHKSEQDRRLIQFLMGLNEVYTSILMMNPLPSMAQAFSLLIQEEKQREVKPQSQLMMESVSLNVNVPSHSSLNRAPMHNNNFRTNYSPNNHSSTSRPRPFCDYCKRAGHTKDKCFKLHGYPQDFNHNPKYQKVKRTAANVHWTPIDNFHVNGEEMQPQSNHSNVSLTKEQYGQLVTLLQHFQTSSGGDNPENNTIGGNANFAGPFNEEASGDW
ncbi:uncharacterized protein LOC107772464 [Nicotiana tabacum]|uniref:Uncharacterized protein LOC107772464 n=1 Tax=Nicotiana tabacum TaxID=4097 RepID=A0AC58US50_TOBAC